MIVFCTHVMQYAVSLQLCVPDFALQHHEFLLILLFECVQTSLTVLQFIDQPLFDGNLTCNVGQICLEVLCQHTKYTECCFLFNKNKR